MPKAKPQKKPAKCWYLAIGVGETDDSTGLSCLEYASSDCRDIAALLEETKLSPIDTVIALHDYGGDDYLPTVENVTKHLVQIQSRAGTKDTVVVYLTCHGIRDSKGRLYFCLFDTKGENKQIDFATAFPAQKLVEILVKSQARNIILLIDSCHIGLWTKNYCQRKIYANY